MSGPGIAPLYVQASTRRPGLSSTCATRASRLISTIRGSGLRSGAAGNASAADTRPAELTRADVEAWLDGFVPYAMGTADIAGGVVVVVKGGAVIAQKGYGYADVATQRPVDPERTLFRAGSVAKLVTSFGVAVIPRTR